MVKFPGFDQQKAVGSGGWDSAHKAKGPDLQDGLRFLSPLNQSYKAACGFFYNRAPMLSPMGWATWRTEEQGGDLRSCGHSRAGTMGVLPRVGQ